MKFALFLGLSSLIAFVAAECPNACSGHGACGNYDMCTCCENFFGNDCSLRTCPNGLAFADSPKGDLNMDRTVDFTSIFAPVSSVAVNDYYVEAITEYYQDNVQDEEAHYYAECSNKGICDRATGTCACFTGFEGSACQRASCPNDCSGHGVCKTIRELAETKLRGEEINGISSVYEKSGIHGLTYGLWDKDSTMGCKCDSRFFGPSCAEMKCPKSVDPLYTGTKDYELTYIDFDCFSTANCAGTFNMYIYDNMGARYQLDNLPYSDYATTPTQEPCTTIMRLLPDLRLNDTVVSNTVTQAFCTVTATSLSAQGMRIVLDYNYGNPGHHTDAEVYAYTETTAGLTRIITQVQTQGKDALYQVRTPRGTNYADDFKFVLPGYIEDYSLTGTSFNMSEDVIDYFMYPYTPLTNRNVRINGNTYNVTAVNSFPLQKYPNTFPFIYEYKTEITVNTTISLGFSRGGIVNGIADDGSSVFTVATNLDVQYQYVDECGNRGNCDRATGQCQCFAGYTKGTCQSQAPVC